MATPTMTAPDVVERVRQLLASAGVTVNRALIGRVVDAVQNAPTPGPIRPDSLVTMDLNRPQPSQFLARNAAARPDGRTERDKIAVLLSAMGIDSADLTKFTHMTGMDTVQGLAAMLYLQGAAIPDDLAAQLGIDLTVAEQVAGMVRSLVGVVQPGTSAAEIGAHLVGRDVDLERFIPTLSAGTLEEAQAAAREAGASDAQIAAATPLPVSHEQLAAGQAAQLIQAGASTAQAVAREQLGRVWVVGPNGQPMLATLATNYQPPALTGTLGADEFQAIVDQQIAAGASEDEAVEAAEQASNEMYAASQGVDHDPLVGVNAGFVAYRTLPGYQTQQWLPSGEMIGGGGPSGTPQEVAVEPLYHESYMSDYWLMSPEDIATLQDGMVKAGMLTEGEFTPGNPLDSYQQFQLLLGVANNRGDTWMDALSALADMEVEERPTFTPSSYQAPDYDTLAETVYEIFSRDLGREPEEWEVRQLASSFGGYYYQQYQAQTELERQQFLAENELPTEQAISAPAGAVSVGGVPVGGMPPAWQQAIDTQRGYSEEQPFRAPAQEDPYSSFMQYFRERYRPEMDMRRQVVNNAYGRDNLFNSIGRMDTLARGGT